MQWPEGEKKIMHPHTCSPTVAHKQRGLKGHELFPDGEFGNSGRRVSPGKCWPWICSDERGKTLKQVRVCL